MLHCKRFESIETSAPLKNQGQDPGLIDGMWDPDSPGAQSVPKQERTQTNWDSRCATAEKLNIPKPVFRILGWCCYRIGINGARRELDNTKDLLRRPAIVAGRLYATTEGGQRFLLPFRWKPTQDRSNGIHPRLFALVLSAKASALSFYQ